jgi:hypothetical protein
MYAADRRDTSAAPSQQRPNLPLRRAAILVPAAALAVLVVVVALSPLPMLAWRIAIEGWFPATISWEGKTAWRRCDSAIAGQTSWPSSPQAACVAMHLCANEAPLTEVQKHALDQAVHDTPGCGAL